MQLILPSDCPDGNDRNLDNKDAPCTYGSMEKWEYKRCLESQYLHVFIFVYFLTTLTTIEMVITGYDCICYKLRDFVPFVQFK